MSLLLEALKKAEKAKEDAQRRTEAAAASQLAASAATPAAAEAAAPSPEAVAAAAAEVVTTREDLPDIPKPLEIVPDEPPARAVEPPPVQEKPRPQARVDPDAGERATARKVFEAKFREPNPRLPFFIALGVLGTFAIGTVAYFWVQLRPAPSLVNLNPKPAAETQVATSAPSRPAAASPAPASQSAIPGLPGTAPIAPAKPEPVVRAPVPETPLLKPPVRPNAVPRAPEPTPTEVTASPRAAPQVHGKVASGYAAYLAGDLATARAEYEQALREEPVNRDATLGLAALDVRAGRFEAAESAYLRLLRADPRDAHAQAALIALRGGRVDPVAAESRMKSMLADNPGAAVLNFTLGNQFASQGRWAEAQQEYFKAFAAEPDNADFAYNLAVSLDHLRQPKLALEYYKRAVTLAKARGAGFDAAAAETRIAQLGR